MNEYDMINTTFKGHFYVKKEEKRGGETKTRGMGTLLCNEADGSKLIYAIRSIKRVICNVEKG